MPSRAVWLTALTDRFGDEIETDADGKYLLSPRDLFGYQEAEALHSKGLTAWKIEGRMKKPQYVAVVCRIYSQILRQLDDNRIVYPDEEDMRQLMQIFNRDRCSAYWHGNPGTAMMSYKRPNNRGMFLGRITEAGNGMITIKLVQKLHRGDGIEIWQTGRREGCTVDTIQRGKAAKPTGRKQGRPCASQPAADMPATGCLKPTTRP